MQRRATGNPSSLPRAIGRLALALAMAGSLACSTPHLAAQQPYPAGQSLIAPSGASGFFDPAAALLSQPVESNPATLTSYLDDSVIGGAASGRPPGGSFDPESRDGGYDWWRWQMLPDGLIYHSYLAGVKEPRFGASWLYDRRLGWFHDIALGGRVGLARYGTAGSLRPEGWQIDFEGAVLPRVDGGSLDVTAMDFRYGVPLTYGQGQHQGKLAFYHLSSHLGDEFMLLNPGVPRINYLRDALAWGQSFYWTPNLRLYVEAAYAFHVDGGAEPWEFQFGIDYARATPTGSRPVPFVAINAHLREEVEFGGNVTFQTGYMWRGTTGNLLRMGLHCFVGKSDQFEFFNQYEEKIGLGMWYDF